MYTSANFQLKRFISSIPFVLNLVNIDLSVSLVSVAMFVKRLYTAFSSLILT